MSKTTKLLIVFCLAVATIAMASTARAGNHCKGAMQMAKVTQCVQAMESQCSPATWRESHDVFDNGDGTLTINFVYEPKCLDDPVPCRIATRLAAVSVDCQAHTATCL